MNAKFAPCIVAAWLFTAACGPIAEQQTEEQGQDRIMGAPAAEDTIYSARGTLTAIGDGTLTIDHEAIAELGWPSMVMEFGIDNAAAVEGLAPGMAVAFSFRRDGNRNIVTAIKRGE